MAIDTVFLVTAADQSHSRSVRVLSTVASMKLRSCIMSLTGLAGIVLWQPVIAQEASVEIASGETANGPAEPETSDPSDEIIVNGARLRISKIKSDLTIISQQVSGQLARYQDPVCVHVSGFPEDSAKVIESAIASLATAAGLEIAGISCRPNLTVIVAPDGREFVERMKIARPELFAQLTGLRRRQLLEQSGPSWSWQSIEPKRADGGPVEYISEISQPGAPPRFVPKGSYMVQGARLSRLALPTRHDVTGTFVVIEQAATIGLTLQQIADYAGMLALSGANERSLDHLSAPSILKVFLCEGQSWCPEAATDFDTAFLKARYSGSADLAADKDLMRIASSITKELSATPLGSEDSAN